jgi:4-hydroxybutyrate dehydrogenase/sulfolactaldehyde 3-reductase
MAGSVGFIGFGRVDRPMATNLPHKGFKVLAHDIDPDAGGAVVRHGARAAANVAELARRSETLLTVLPTRVEVGAPVRFAPGRHQF